MEGDLTCALGIRRSLIAIGVLMLSAVLCPAGRAHAVGQTPIAELNEQTWKMAEGLLPEEFLDRYKSGEWRHQIYEPPAGTHLSDEDFIAAGPGNEGKYALGAEGQVVEVATGQQPTFVYGPPFPTIDPKDPQAGAKCVWNFFYQSYLVGSSRNFVNLDWVGTKGMERRMATDVFQKFWDGQPEKYRPKDNPQNFLFQQMTNVTRPADLQGTVAMTHRFRDPKQRDQVWTYVPALRRVRAVSPANRSDGFLGSDMAQDDGSYFDGKPEDFTWKLVGEGEMLVMIDREALLEQKANLRRLPDGSTEATDSLRPRFAYQAAAEGEVQGLAWGAPSIPSAFSSSDRCGSSKAFPRIATISSARSFSVSTRSPGTGTYNSKYDWQGAILNSYMPLFRPYFDVGGEWRGYASVTFTMSQNWRMNRATVSYADPQNPKYQSRMGFQDGFFTVDSLMRQGK